MGLDGRCADHCSFISKQLYSSRDWLGLVVPSVLGKASLVPLPGPQPLLLSVPAATTSSSLCTANSSSIPLQSLATRVSPQFRCLGDRLSHASAIPVLPGPGQGHQTEPNKCLIHAEIFGKPAHLKAERGLAFLRLLSLMPCLAQPPSPLC
jgi:hypothetical protein